MKFTFNNGFEFDPTNNESDLQFALSILHDAPEDEAIRFAAFLKTNHPIMWNDFMNMMEETTSNDFL